VGKRMKNYLNQIDKQTQGELSADDKKVLKENLLVQIGFFQHERIIHLIVTVTFAISTVISLMCVIMSQSIIMAVFLILLLALLIPYIRHNYILEKGVQKLYEYYDKLQ
jgi:choline-glycine betaine transporter